MMSSITHYMIRGLGEIETVLSDDLTDDDS